MPLTGDPAEFRGLRWASIERPDDWIATCYAPAQFRRFLSKLKRTLGPATATA